MKYVLTALLISALPAFAWTKNGTVYTIDGTEADFTSAHTDASDGDTIRFLAGEYTWTTFAGNITKAITIEGAGIGQTYIINNIPSGNPSTQQQLFRIPSTTAGKTYRITGFEFKRGTVNHVWGEIYIDGASDLVRIDNCKWNNVQNYSVIWDDAGGVIDNCEVFNDSTGGENKRFLLVSAANKGSSSWGDGDWSSAIDWGGNASTVYVEDCTITRAVNSSSQINGCVDMIYGGGRAVFRDNVITNAFIGNHGTESSNRYRSGRKFEVYRNTFLRTGTGDHINAHVLRGGTSMFWGNTMSAQWTNAIQITAYRRFFAFTPWGAADGTLAWDTNDTSDDGTGDDNTPAGDGIFCSGTATSGANLELTDTSKSWITDQWVGYSLRQINSLTATSGGVRSVTVSGAGWATNQWAGAMVTKTATNQKAVVNSNNADTLTLQTDGFALDMTGGGAFILSRASEIIDNDSDTLTVMGGFTSFTGYANFMTFGTGDVYEIRRVIYSLDEPGAGVTSAISPGGTSNINHQNLSQQRNPIYSWSNNLNGNLFPGVTEGGYANFVEDVHYFKHESTFDGSTGLGVGGIASRPASGSKVGVGYWATDQGEWDSTNGSTADGQLTIWNGSSWVVHYTPYTYPHPLRGVSPSIRNPGRKAKAGRYISN